MAMSNNTMGASIYDLGKVIQSDSLSELNTALKSSEQKQQEMKQQEMQNQQQMQQQQQQSQQELEKMKIDAVAAEKEKDRQRDILVAEIRAAGYGSMVDVNKNEESDYVDAMKEIRQTEQYQEQTSLERMKESNRTMQNSAKNDIEREKIQAQKDIADKQLQIARENKNRFDSGKGEKSK
jgi:hypothetical protein